MYKFMGIALLVLILISIVFVIGCATRKSMVIPDDSKLSPIALEGKKLVEERCITCHGLNKVYSEKEDRSGWEKYVDSMIKKGAKLDKEEREKVLEYLTSIK